MKSVSTPITSSKSIDEPPTSSRGVGVDLTDDIKQETSPAPTSSSSPPASAPPPNSDLQSALEAKETEVELWKSRAMKLRSASKNTPSKPPPLNSAFEELAKEAQGMQEKIHLLTTRVRELNKEKTAFVEVQKKLEGDVKKAEDEKREGVEGSKMETEALVRNEMESSLSETLSSHNSQILKLKTSHSNEISALNDRITALEGKVESARGYGREVEVKYDAVCFERSKVEQVWVARLRKVEEEAERRRGEADAGNTALRDDRRLEEERKRRGEVEGRVKELEGEVMRMREEREVARNEAKEGMEIKRDLEGKVKDMVKVKGELDRIKGKYEESVRENGDLKTKGEAAVREVNKRIIEGGIKWDEERGRLEGMIEGLERELGGMRREREKEIEKKEGEGKRAERESKRTNIMYSRAAGGPSFAATVQMRNQIELLREENNFVKKEIEDLRAATEGDAELIAKAKEEGKELKMLREEVGGFREEVEDGKEAIKEVREMYRREIQRLLGEGDNPDDPKSFPSPNPQLYSPEPETPKKVGFKGNLKRLVGVVKTPRVEMNQDWDPWEL